MNPRHQQRSDFQEWRIKRLRQYADRTGLSLQQVLVLLAGSPRDRSFKVIAREIDRIVDPSFQLSNMPAV